MTVNFPNLKPTKRSYQVAEYPTKQFQSLNGASVIRLYGSLPVDATLSLQFIVNDEALEDVTQCFDRARGAFDDLDLPDEVFVGMSANVFPNHLRWRWADPPSIESIQPDLSRVSVNLKATLEVTP